MKSNKVGLGDRATRGIPNFAQVNIKFAQVNTVTIASQTIANR